MNPDISLDSFVAAYSPLNPEAVWPQFKTLFDGLRNAGFDIPEELP